jgi:CheY-like chemotaxis protein
MSEPGKGSTFTISLPVKKAQVKPAIKVSNTSKKENIIEKLFDEERESKGNEVRYISSFIPHSVEDDRETLTPTDKAILIVEDDINFAKTLLEYTRKKGYKGIVAVRGDEGIELAKQFKPLGVLLDIQLPVRDGWEVMDELKANPETRHIPVHIMSSNEVRKKSLTKGAVDFINKPMAFEQMDEAFKKIEQVLNRSKKVLIVEENAKHAQALEYYLEMNNVNSEIKNSVNEGINALIKEDMECVILDMGVPDQRSYDTLEEVKKTPGLENLPIIIFTGKSLSKAEELRIKQYADSIVIKTAHSYKRIIDEVSLFLHLIEENKQTNTGGSYKKLGLLNEVLKDKKIMVVDDDVRNIFSITKALEAYSVKVLSATDGKEALEQLEKNPEIDLILMDMMMPEMDGYEATAEIRKIQKFRNLPVIAVTAKAMSGDRERCISAGASDYVTKPVDIDQLLSLLRVWLYDKQ